MGLTVLRHIMNTYPRARLVLIDSNRDVCERVASRHANVHVVYGSLADVHVLEKAGVRHADYYVAVTGDDAANIISALLARREGARNVIVRVNRPGYDELARMLGIENVVAPAMSTAIQIDQMIRGPGFIDLNRLVMGEIDIREMIVTGDSELNGITLPRCVIGGEKGHLLFIVRGKDLIIPEGGVVLKPGDRLVVARPRRPS